jgi:hypothetical protein
MQQRGTAAAVESFRNETVKRSDLTNALLTQVSQPRELIQAVDIRELSPGEPD